MLLRVIVVVQRYCSFFVVWDLVVFLFSFFFSSLFLYFFFFCLRLRNMSRLSWVASLFLVDFPFLVACLFRLSVSCVACRIFSGGARARCVPIFPQAGGMLFLPLFGLPVIFVPGTWYLVPGIIFLGMCFLFTPYLFSLSFSFCLSFLSLSFDAPGLLA